ncbi:MAG: 50S ribosomal protein L10 [Deltaproteobacteria bacterium]|nr:50S ribosomal protein L10 [Deltaproteobacteria bacterium]
MDRQEKTTVVGEFQDKFRTATMAVVTDYRGLSVGKMTQLRCDVREAAGEYKIAKNNLVRLAIRETSYEPLEDFLTGPNGWVFAYDDPVSLSKALVKFADANAELTIKGAVLDGALLEPVQVKGLASLPSLPELQAQVLSLMQAPATRLLQTIQEPGGQLVRLLEACRASRE